jgi:hypothetical protein
MLSVPIPMNKEIKMTVKYFPQNLAERPKEFSLNVGEYVTVSEIKQKIIDSLPNKEEEK